MSTVYLDIDRIVTTTSGITLDAERFGALVRSELQRVLEEPGALAPSTNVDLARLTTLQTGNPGPRNLARTLAQSIGRALRKAG